MSIPTSIIVVLLVAAWLTVLVPMVARRREPVPESEMDGGTFRVLRRASASIRRRPRLGRRDEADVDDAYLEVASEDSVEELDEELMDDDSDEFSDDEFDDNEEVAEYEEVAVVEEIEYEQVGYVREPATVGARAASWGRGRAAIDESSYETDSYSPAVTVERDQYGSAPRESIAQHPPRRDARAEIDEAHLRPIPRRPGRGGFDPDAAEAARAYRFSRRRRVTVMLLLTTVAFSAGAYLYKPILWSGTAVFGLLLVAYLTYLRRQVRIENDIRERRLARLRRARQIRPEYHALEREDAVPTPPPYASSAVQVSQVPPSGYRRGREVIDLDDDDPSFDDLDYYMPVTYRRASGQ